MPINLYEKSGGGDDFAKKFDEAEFVIAIWDSCTQKLVITNDRFGFYRLFYTVSNDQFIFSPEMKGILCCQSRKKEIDLVALAQYMRFQHLLGDRTFFDGIHLLPGGSS